MQILRHGQHGDRRRRLITEDAMSASTPNADPPAARPAAARPAKAATRKRAGSAPYGDGSCLDRQPRVTDLVPKHYSTLGLLVLLGLVLIAGLEVLYAWMPQLIGMTHGGRVAAFDLDGEGGLAAWFSCALLAAASGVALLVYSVRRHRLDDYHARYRVWLWAAACWLMMSLDEGASLHEGFKEFMTAVTGRRLMGDGSVYWVAGYLLVLGTIGVRLLLEMRPCRASRAALAGAAAAFATAIVAQLQWIMPQTGMRGVMVEQGCEMLGDLLLLVAMALHARYVILEAQGALPSRGRADAAEADQSAKRKSKLEAAAQAAKRSDLDPVAQPPASLSAQADTAKAVDDDYEDDLPERGTRRARPQRHRIDEAEDLPAGGKLAKADRKALRRQKEKQRRGELD
ncbi:MAG TPA: hypothetical protein VIK18_25045 [Pirellulales bacterium]